MICRWNCSLKRNRFVDEAWFIQFHCFSSYSQCFWKLFRVSEYFILLSELSVLCDVSFHYLSMMKMTIHKTPVQEAWLGVTCFCLPLNSVFQNYDNKKKQKNLIWKELLFLIYSEVTQKIISDWFIRRFTHINNGWIILWSKHHLLNRGFIIIYISLLQCKKIYFYPSSG